MKRIYYFCLALWVLAAGGLASCGGDDEPERPPQKVEPVKPGKEDTGKKESDINHEVDKYLKDMYLWNDEYKTLTLDYTKDYDAFFYEALLSLTTNGLDKRMNAYGEYSLFSYIEKRNPVAASSRNTGVEKELEYSFGITGITPVSIGTATNYTTYFCIQGVYPDSPAADAGIKRGNMISKVNGAKITQNNIVDLFYQLVMPEEARSLVLTEGVVADSLREIPLASEAMYCNPVILGKVEEREDHRIGYLVYAGFDAAFDQELLDAFKDFKTQGVTDLVVDLRYNGGGHTIAANLMAACIAGEAAKGKVFSSLRFNKDRMAKLNGKRQEEVFFYPRYDYLDKLVTGSALNLSKVYCLVGNATASASELVINSLRGIDVEVVLIGEQTTGKNVGMEYKDITVDKDNYRVVPITFQSYNAKGFGDYEAGFTPDWNINETNPRNEEGMFYRHRDYATPGEPLYAKAVELITGKPLQAEARSAAGGMAGRAVSLPMPYRPGRSGMLREAEKETAGQNE